MKATRSATGTRTVADLMFADFMFEAGGQIVLQVRAEGDHAAVWPADGA